MTSYNFDFLLAGQVILLMVLYHFFTQKRLDDRNNRIFCVMLLLGGLDVLAELSSVFCIMSGFDRCAMCGPCGTTRWCRCGSWPWGACLPWCCFASYC